MEGTYWNIIIVLLISYEKYVFDFVFFFFDFVFLKQPPYYRNLCVNEDTRVWWWWWWFVTRSWL